MKLWILKPVDGLPGVRDRNVNPWEPWYDKMFGVVVRASDEQAARRVASESCSDEGPSAWAEPKFSTCVELTAEGEEGVVLTDVASA